jgi:pimeloyl-ACP methyl ester carboxylesterase
MWRHMQPVLGERRRVVALDTLGFGNSDPAPPGCSLSDFAANALDAMDALGVGEADLLGAMTGSRIALRMAAMAPARVRRLALVGFPFFTSEESKRRRFEETDRFRLVQREPDGSHLLRIWTYTMAQLAGRGNDHAASGADLALWRSHPVAGPSPIAELGPRQMDYLEDWMVDVTRCGPIWAATAKTVYGTDPRDDLASLRIPLLFVGLNGAGFGDYLQEESARAAHGFASRARFVLLDAPDADSRFPYTHAEELCGIVEEFLGAPAPS